MPDLPNISQFCMSLGARGRLATNQNSPSRQLCRETIMGSLADIPARAADTGRANYAAVPGEFTRSGTNKASTSSP